MRNIDESLLLIIGGVLTVSVIDSVGSIASRKWNFNYGYLSPISFLVYTTLGYLGQKFLDNLPWTLIIPVIVGIYDGTVGWKISIVLNANYGKYEESKTLKLSDRVFAMIGISTLFGFIGYHIYNWSN